jgi:hypothetical protein
MRGSSSRPRKVTHSEHSPSARFGLPHRARPKVLSQPDGQGALRAGHCWQSLASLGHESMQCMWIWNTRVRVSHGQPNAVAELTRAVVSIQRANLALPAPADERDAHLSVASELKGRLKECADCRPPMHPPPLHSYYNATTGQSSWEVPPEFRAMVNSAAAAAAPVGAAQQVSAQHCATALHCTAPPPHTRPLKAFGAFTITRCTCRACVPIDRLRDVVSHNQWRHLERLQSMGQLSACALPCPVHALLTIECLYWPLVYLPPAFALYTGLQLSYEELLERERMLEYSKKKKSGE